MSDESIEETNSAGIYGRLADLAINQFGRVATVVLLLTGLLAIPFLALVPTESASTEPGGPVFDARDTIEDRFVSSVFPVGLIVEAKEGSLADKEQLLALSELNEDLRADQELSESLLTFFSPDFDTDVVGMLNFADLVEMALQARGEGSLSQASQDEIDDVVAELIQTWGTDAQELSLSQKTEFEDGRWDIPAATTFILFDSNDLGFAQTAVNLGGDTEPEEFSRSVQEVFRSSEVLSAYGVAIDVNLTSQEQGELAGPFIGLTIFAVVLIVGFTFRSYWTVAIVGVAFSMLIIWLKGISNLIGFRDDLVLSLIVPIAMVSFGIDFAFHAIGRYREERDAGTSGKRGLVVGLTAVGTALLLALASDATAFLSNLVSGIESINQFGIGSAIALASAYVLLGYVAPAGIGLVESTVSVGKGTRAGKAGVVVGSILAALLSMATVLFLVFILPWVGLVLLAINIIATIVVPYLVARRREKPEAVAIHNAGSWLGPKLALLTKGLIAKPVLTVITAVTLTAVAAVFALRVDVEFDVEDFFASDTDFVIGLDKLDEHVGDQGGEPAEVLVTGNLSDPETLGELKATLDDFAGSGAANFATTSEGILQVDEGIFEVLSLAVSDPARTIIGQAIGTELTDENSDGIPDTEGQVAAVLEFASQTGVPFSQNQLQLTPDDVDTRVDVADSNSVTLFEFGLTNSREQSSVTDAAASLDEFAGNIEVIDGLEAQATGGAIVRNASLTATSDALLLSLPIAIVVCFLIASLALRSVQLGLISVVPIVMVVAWLYALMYFMGFSINLVTATIAAVSVGIGIDFAIHYIVRFVEEADNGLDAGEALVETSMSTGVALAASAVSSIVGFGVLAFAPMPLFASYGLLTAVMIALALLSTFTVLPGMLALLRRS